MPGIVVSLGCHNKIPQTGWLKQQILISHSSGGQKSKIKFLVGFSFWLSSWLTDGSLFTKSLHGLSLVHVLGKREGKLTLDVSVRTLILSDHSLIFITPFNFNYFHKGTLGVKVQHMNWKRHNLVHNTQVYQQFSSLQKVYYVFNLTII